MNAHYTFQQHSCKLTCLQTIGWWTCGHRERYKCSPIRVQSMTIDTFAVTLSKPSKSRDDDTTKPLASCKVKLLVQLYITLKISILYYWNSIRSKIKEKWGIFFLQTSEVRGLDYWHRRVPLLSLPSALYLLLSPFIFVTFSLYSFDIWRLLWCQALVCKRHRCLAPKIPRMMPTFSDSKTPPTCRRRSSRPRFKDAASSQVKFEATGCQWLWNWCRFFVKRVLYHAWYLLESGCSWSLRARRCFRTTLNRFSPIYTRLIFHSFHDGVPIQVVVGSRFCAFYWIDLTVRAATTCYAPTTINNGFLVGITIDWPFHIIYLFICML